ncbi:MAG: peptidylprolyl isomerase [Pseudomonadales bacterium]|nr:peptidylprolyl isomerase [Pseudomonadales bacterium]
MRFIQFRTQSFTDNAGEKLDSLSSDALADIITQYIQEEALYRQAMAYGMAKDDYVIKRRMVQKMEFLAEGTTPAVTSLTTSELEAYYEEHREDYKVPAAVTFTHVFFSADRHGNVVDKLAQETLGILTENHVRFDQAPNYGERFPYQLNYVERTQEEVASHFGEEMAQAIFRLQPHKARWQGPVRSEFGMHLVLLTRAEAARIPPLQEVRDQLANELQRRREVERKQKAIDELIGGFEVRLSPEFEGVSER